MLKNLPLINYDLAIRAERPIEIIIPDILVRLKHKITDKEQQYLFFNYLIKDGETPEIISYNNYGTMDHHWVIMYINDRFDYVSDFPISDINLEKFIKNKYGEDKMYDIHHYEDGLNNIVDDYYYDHKNNHGKQPTGITAELPTFIPSVNLISGLPVTNYDYEDKINESKRIIKLIKPAYISQFVNSYETALRETTQ